MHTCNLCTINYTAWPIASHVMLYIASTSLDLPILSLSSPMQDLSQGYAVFFLFNCKATGIVLSSLSFVGACAQLYLCDLSAIN